MSVDEVKEDDGRKTKKKKKQQQDDQEPGAAVAAAAIDGGKLTGGGGAAQTDIKRAWLRDALLLLRVRSARIVVISTRRLNIVVTVYNDATDE